MIKHKYGDFEENQVEEYKKRLHSKIHRLLLEKDRNVELYYENNYDKNSFPKFFQAVMKEIDGLNALLFYPEELVEITSLLEAAFQETQKEHFKFQKYRSLMLNAHSLVDKIGGERK